MGKLDRANGQFYADNVIDYLLFFENSQTWTASAGTGTAALDNTLAFTGSNSLRLENTDPTNDLEVTNSAQSTIIGVGGDYQFSYFVRKDDTGVTYTGHVEIFKGGSTYYTQAFSIDEDETWIRIVNDAPLSFLKSDEVTIKIQLDGVSGYADPSTVLNIDGIMLNLNERQNGMPPQYVRPVFNKTLETPDVVLENLIVDTFGLSALSTAPSSASDTGTLGEVRIDADYIYICTATNTWKRVAISTW